MRNFPAQPTFVGYATSNDGGNTWTDRGAFFNLIPSSSNLNGAQPTVTWNSVSQKFVAATRQLKTTPPPTRMIGVSTSADGITWSSGVNASGQYSNNLREPSIAVDQANGRTYVCWDEHNGFSSSRLWFSRSLDGGQTFQPPQLLRGNASGSYLGHVRNCSVAVGVQGDVYVGFWDGDAAVKSHMLRRSADAGATFAPTVAIGSAVAPPVSGLCKDFFEQGLPALPVSVGGTDIRAAPASSIVTDPNLASSVYATWTTYSGNPARMSVLFSRSLDYGQTWSSPVVLSSLDGNDHFFARIATFSLSASPPRNLLRVIWYRRFLYAGYYFLDVLQTESNDTGTTWGQVSNVSTASSLVPQLLPNFDNAFPSCYFGDRLGLTDTSGGQFLNAWGDTRTMTNDKPDPDIRAGVGC